MVEVAYMECCSGGENEANMQGTSFTFYFSVTFYAYSSWPLESWFVCFVCAAISGNSKKELINMM